MGVGQLEDMRTFCAVVEAEGFSAAARRLGVAPSSVSRQVGELEAALGVRLLHRTTRRLSLTEAGELYAERSRRILAEVDEADLAVSQLDGRPTGILRVTAPSSIAGIHIVPALAEFQADHPGVRVVLSLTDRVVDIVGEGFDLAVRIGRQRDSALVAKKLGEVPRSVCASPRYLEAAGIPRRPEQLAEHACLVFRSTPGPAVWRFKGAAGSVDVRVRGPLVTLDGGALVTAACGGMGLVLVPQWLTSSALADGRLRRVLRRYAPIPATTPLYAVYPHRSLVPPKVRAFVSFLARRLAGGDKRSR